MRPLPCARSHAPAPMRPLPCARSHAPAAFTAQCACATGRYTDALLGSTFAELRRDYMAEMPSDALRLPDAAAIPSAIAQARAKSPTPPQP
jgi:hypothetical protein